MLIGVARRRPSRNIIASSYDCGITNGTRSGRDGADAAAAAAAAGGLEDERLSDDARSVQVNPK